MHDEKMIGAAEHMAKWLHRDQVDRQGRSYYLHLVEVAVRVWVNGGSAEQRAAAWLHDSIEDGHIGIGAIRAVFSGTKVPDLVWELTRDKSTETYSEYIDRLIDSDRAALTLTIKLADIESNLDRATKEMGSLVVRYEDARRRIKDARRRIREALQKGES